MHASVYEVEGLEKGKSYLAGLDHFELRQLDSGSADVLLSTPHTSLYAFDDAERLAVFVETPPEVDLTAAPFYYLAQKEHARRVFTVPYETFNELAQTLPDPANLILLHSVGRCGSTLLCKALGELGGTTLSEPDVYTCVAGMRLPGGSRDAELTELLRSATRFHCHSPRFGNDTVWLLKFRAQCIEIGDLLYEAFPDACTLFLGRDLESWIRSIGRLLKLGDPEKEAYYRANKEQATMFGYPRERYVSLLRSASTPETRLEDTALLWTSIVKRFVDLEQKGAVSFSLTYKDLTENPEATLRAVAQACQLPTDNLENALKTFEHDSQAGTHLSGRTLREQGLYELNSEDIKRAEAVARQYGLEPDTSRLPGHLPNG